MPINQSRLYAVVHYPRLASEALDGFRRRHDPFSDLIAEHLTLVFPVPVDLQTIRAHTEAVATRTRPFDVRIAGLSRTWDHWLYLELQEGREEVIRLHDRLYSGPLAGHLRADLPFEPHVGIGFFGEGPYDPLDPEAVELDSEAYERAKTEADELGIDARRRVESVTIVRLDTQQSRLENVREVGLGLRPEG